MHLKALPASQQPGCGQRAVQYLLSECDASGERRASVRVLRGDPWIVQRVIDSLDFKHRYTSGVVAWHQDDAPTDAQISRVVDDLEALMFAGLDKDQYTWTVIEHRDSDGGAEVLSLLFSASMPKPQAPRRAFRYPAIRIATSSPWWASVIAMNVCLVAIIAVVATAGLSGTLQQLKLANAQGQGQFSLDDALGEIDKGTVIAFDRKTRKMALITTTSYRILPIDAITRWTLVSNVRTNGVVTWSRIEVSLNDYHQPLVHAYVGSPEAGNAWVERLDTLLTSFRP